MPALPSDPNARARAGVEAIFARYHKLAALKKNELHDYDCMTRAELVHAEPGHLVIRLTITQAYANLNGVLHGGGCGVLFDMFTMLSLGTVSAKGYWEFMGGVSRTINMSYLRAVPVGMTVLFKSWVVSHGKRFAMLRGEMTDEKGTTVLATAEHHKIYVPTPKEQMEYRVEWDDMVDEEEEERKKKKKKKKKDAKL